jgi:hypothetical protein
VIETGTFDELVQAGRAFAALAEAQFMGSEQPAAAVLDDDAEDDPLSARLQPTWCHAARRRGIQ